MLKPSFEIANKGRRAQIHTQADDKKNVDVRKNITSVRPVFNARIPLIIAIQHYLKGAASIRELIQ